MPDDHLRALLDNSPEARAGVADALGEFHRHWIAADGRKAAAVAVVLVGSNRGLGIWLTERTTHLRAHAGQFALPGGRLDEDEDPVGAALRELWEELGVRLRRADVLGRLDDFATRSGYRISPVVVWAGEAPDLTPNPAEVARVHRISLADLDITPRFVSIPQSDRPVIQLPLLGTLVHAPTAAVLHQFREVVLHRRHTRVAHLEQPVFAWS